MQDPQNMAKSRMNNVDDFQQMFKLSNLRALMRTATHPPAVPNDTSGLELAPPDVKINTPVPGDILNDDELKHVADVGPHMQSSRERSEQAQDSLMGSSSTTRSSKRKREVLTGSKVDGDQESQKVRIVASAPSQALHQQIEILHQQVEKIQQEKEDLKQSLAEENCRLRLEKEALDLKLEHIVSIRSSQLTSLDEDADDCTNHISTQPEVSGAYKQSEYETMSATLNAALRVSQESALFSRDLELKLEAALNDNNAEIFQEERRVLVLEHTKAIKCFTEELDDLKAKLLTQEQRLQSAEKDLTDTQNDVKKQEAAHIDIIHDLGKNLQDAVDRELRAIEQLEGEKERYHNQIARLMETHEEETNAKNHELSSHRQRLKQLMNDSTLAKDAAEQSTAELSARLESLTHTLNVSSQMVTALREEKYDLERNLRDLSQCADDRLNLLDESSVRTQTYEADKATLSSQILGLQSQLASAATENLREKDQTLQLSSQLSERNGELSTLKAQQQSLQEEHMNLLASSEEKLARLQEMLEARDLAIEEDAHTHASIREEKYELERNLRELSQSADDRLNLLNESLVRTQTYEADKATLSSQILGLQSQLASAATENLREKDQTLQLSSQLSERNGELSALKAQQQSLQEEHLNLLASSEEKLARLQEMLEARDLAIEEDARMYASLKDALNEKHEDLDGRNIDIDVEMHTDDQLLPSTTALGKRREMTMAQLASIAPHTFNLNSSRPNIGVANLLGPSSMNSEDTRTGAVPRERSRTSRREFTLSSPLNADQAERNNTFELFTNIQTPQKDYLRRSTPQNMSPFNSSLIPPVLPPGGALRRQPTPGPSNPAPSGAPHRHTTPGPTSPSPLTGTHRQSTPGPSNQRNMAPLPDAYHDVTPGGSDIDKDMFSMESGISPLVARKLFEMAEAIGKIEANLPLTGRADASPFRVTPRSKYTPSPFKQKTTRRGQTQAHLDMMRDIRHTMNAMLGIKRDRNIVEAVKNGHIITEEEANAAMDCTPPHLGDNLTFMRPFWHKLKSDYNILLGDIFTEHFIDLNPEYEGQEEEIVDHFYQRLSTLKAEITKHLPRPTETEEDAARRAYNIRMTDLRKKRVRRRKTEGYARRLSDVQACVDTNPSFQPILDTVYQLGIEGYSSDETCDEGYLVKQVPWRSRELEKILYFARACHPTTNINGNRNPGGQSRSRLYHTYAPLSQSAAPEGLPLNFYDQTWYQGLSYPNRNCLKPLPEVDIPGETL